METLQARIDELEEMLAKKEKEMSEMEEEYKAAVADRESELARTQSNSKHQMEVTISCTRLRTRNDSRFA